MLLLFFSYTNSAKLRSDTKNDFDEADIIKRHDLIIDSFISYLDKNNLLK